MGSNCNLSSSKQCNITQARSDFFIIPRALILGRRWATCLGSPVIHDRFLDLLLERDTQFFFGTLLFAKTHENEKRKLQNYFFINCKKRNLCFIITDFE